MVRSPVSSAPQRVLAGLTTPWARVPKKFARRENFVGLAAARAALTRAALARAAVGGWLLRRGLVLLGLLDLFGRR